MFSKIKKVVHSFASLKGKLLLLFLLVVIVMGGICVGTYLSMKSVNDKLDTMAETTISANSIKAPAKEALELLSAYFMDKKEEDQAAIKKKLAQITAEIGHLKKLVRDEEGLNSIDSLTGLMVSYDEAIQKAVDILKNSKGNVGNEFLAQQDEAKKINGFVDSEVQNLIAIELGSYQKIKADLDRTIALTGLLVLVAIIVIGVLTALGVFIYLNKVIGTLTKVAAAAGDIAAGNLRIKEMKLKSRDEVALLAGSFNKMSENLRDLIGKIIENSTQVADAAEFLKNSAVQSSKASEQIAATIGQVSQGASEQAAESQKTVNVITELLESNQKVFENALQVLDAAGKASNTARIGNENVNRLINQIAVIEEEITAAQAKSAILQQRSQEIGEILSLITGMAEQTNLLSLNASIEAARAGEYGKGFAIVANEVRKLADGSARATENIAELLQEIRDESSQVAAQMVTGVEKVKTGTAIAQETRNAFDLLVSTSNDTDSGVKTITGEIEKMIQELKKVAEMNENIAAISEQSSASSQEVAAATEEQTASLEEITSAASSLSNMAGDLQGMAQKFQL